MLKEKRKTDSNKKNGTYRKLSREYFEFYNANLRRKHAIFYIILMVIFFVLITTYISSINTQNFNDIANDSQNAVSQNMFSTILKQKIPLVLIIVFAGITPYVYIPVMGLIYSLSLANSIFSIFGKTNNHLNLILSSIGGIIQLFGIGLAIATGIYYCILCTKKAKYNRVQQFGINDFKRSLYELTKNKKKMDELNKKVEEATQKREQFNVKIPYKNILISTLISVVIVVIGSIIAQI